MACGNECHDGLSEDLIGMPDDGPFFDLRMACEYRFYFLRRNPMRSG